MNKEEIKVITDKEDLYDKCENMEQVFDNYYLPLLNIHYKKTYELQNDIKTLLKENEANEKVIKKQDYVINELEKWCDDCITCHIAAREDGQTTISDTFFETVLNKIKELKENKQ